MQSRWFWKGWALDYRIIGYGLALLFIFSMFFLGYGYLKGPSAVIDWETYQHQLNLETVAHTFEVGNFELAVPIESYLTYEYLNGGSLKPNTLASYIFLVAITACFLVLITIISTLERFWFIVGMGLFVLFAVSLRLEVLRLFAISGRTIPIILMAVFVLIGFYFNMIRSSSPFLLRLLVFAIPTVIIGFMIRFFAGVEYPFLHLSTTAYLPGLILSVVFILMIAHEIMASFVYVTSSGTASSKSLQHFMIITIIYVINLVITYMHEVQLIDWNFLYIDLYLLLSVSTLLGLWGFKHRENLYENILPFNPLGAFLFGSLAVITFATTGMLLGNHNDPALKIIRDVIIFSHLGYSVIFFIYIVSNFMIMMAENLSAWKVLYKPTRMPYFTFRFAGLIATMAFVFYSNWRDYVYHGTSGFYNHLGDLYQLLDKQTLAEAYYQQGRRYGFENNHSNYMLGILETRKNNFKQAYFHYALANGRRPTEYSLINEGNLYLVQKKYFEGIASLRKAHERFPSSGVIENNLAYAYSKIHKLDSALLLFDKARNRSFTRPVAGSNFLALIGHEYLPVQADSLLQKFKSTSPVAIGNALAVATLQNQSFTYPVEILKDKHLDLASATLLNNYLVHSLKQLDSTTINAAYRVASDSLNDDYSIALKATLAQAFYYQNNVSKALDAMAELVFISQMMQGKFNYIAGLWALEQGCPELALLYFNHAVQFDYKEARLYNAIALAEAGRLDEARAEADSLVKHRDEGVREVGRQLQHIAAVSPNHIAALSDLEKYQFCRYRISTKDTLQFDKILVSFQNNDYKAAALLEMARRQLDMARPHTALRYLNEIDELLVTDRKLAEEIRHFQLIMMAAYGEIKVLAEMIGKGITFSRAKELERLLFEALIHEDNANLEIAERNYFILAYYNPFFEEGVLAAARYFKSHAEDDMMAYSILARAIHTNTTSYRLWMAYAREAFNVGFDNQATYAIEQATELRRRK
jgi:Flp pilus assembly protein TadD